MAFCQEDRARYQLLFTVAVPGSTPSADAYAASLASYGRLVDYLAVAGVTDTDDVDHREGYVAGPGDSGPGMPRKPYGCAWRPDWTNQHSPG